MFHARPHPLPTSTGYRAWRGHVEVFCGICAAHREGRWYDADTEWARRYLAHLDAEPAVIAGHRHLFSVCGLI